MPRSPAFENVSLLAVAVAVVDERCQQFHLALGFQYRLVRAIQIVEVSDQCIDARCDLKRLEHVTAYEVGEIAH